METKKWTYRPKLEKINGDEFKKIKVPVHQRFNVDKINLSTSYFKFKEATHNAVGEECLFFKGRGRKTYYTRDQIFDLLEFGNIICEEDNIIHDFIFNTPLEDFPLYINDDTFAPFAKWIMEVGR